MRMSFHRIAYEALEVCNALEMTAVEAAVARADLPAGARALDIGCGNAAVSIRLAQRFGLDVTAVELDPVMADLAEARIAASGAPVCLVRGSSGDVLAASAPFDLIVAIGTTRPAGGDLVEPADVLPVLTEALTPGGRLLWGDLTWRADPAAPLRQVVEASNRYLDDAGWRATFEAAGLEVVTASISSDQTWDRYTTAMAEAARGWLDAHPDSPEANGVRTAAGRVAAMFDFGRPWLDFGLYLARRGA